MTNNPKIRPFAGTAHTVALVLNNDFSKNPAFHKFLTKNGILFMAQTLNFRRTGNPKIRFWAPKENLERLLKFVDKFQK